MSEQIPQEKPKTKCPLGFTSWFGKKPSNIETNENNIVKLNEEIKTHLQN